MRRRNIFYCRCTRSRGDNDGISRKCNWNFESAFLHSSEERPTSPYSANNNFGEGGGKFDVVGETSLDDPLHLCMVQLFRKQNYGVGDIRLPCFFQVLFLCFS